MPEPVIGTEQPKDRPGAQSAPERLGRTFARGGLVSIALGGWFFLTALSYALPSGWTRLFLLMMLPLSLALRHWGADRDARPGVGSEPRTPDSSRQAPRPHFRWFMETLLPILFMGVGAAVNLLVGPSKVGMEPLPGNLAYAIVVAILAVTVFLGWSAARHGRGIHVWFVSMVLLSWTSPGQTTIEASYSWPLLLAGGLGGVLVGVYQLLPQPRLKA
jgi:hypothetical protein